MEHEPSSPDLSTPPPQPKAADDGEDMAYFKRVLRHLIEIGDDLAAMVHEEAAQAVQAQREANAQNPNPPPLVVPREIKESYERITRSVRRSLVLYLKLNEPPKPTPDRVAARRKIIRDVEDKIHAKAPPGEAENLRAELVERLERPEFDDEIANRSIAEIITEICRDLGVDTLHATNPWRRRTPRDIAILQARAAWLYGQNPTPELAALLGKPPRPNDS